MSLYRELAQFPLMVDFLYLTLSLECRLSGAQAMFVPLTTASSPCVLSSYCSFIALTTEQAGLFGGEMGLCRMAESSEEGQA